jgi:type I restriction enzyme R subunit
MDEADMTTFVTESLVESLVMSLLDELGWSCAYEPDVEPECLAAERDGFDEVVLGRRFRKALRRLNPGLPESALDDAARKVLVPATASLYENNRRFHRFLVDGVEVEYTRPDGSIAGDRVRLVDFDDPDANDWLAINQFTVVDRGGVADGAAGAASGSTHTRRPDVVLFVNGLPLGVFELKNAADEGATIKHAFNQLQTYKHEIPSLFTFNEALVVSDGLQARHGTLTAHWERFMPWRTVEGDAVTPEGTPQLPTLVKGIFEKRRFLDLLRSFIVFEVDGATIVKKMAAYHQYHAVNRAVDCTLQAVAGDPRVGVVWHTQGSGKSLSMAFYAGKLIREPEMANPTIVVITDRNDLDDQLFGTFAECRELLRQAPVQAESRDNLREKLAVASGGVVFTTVQKFLPDEKGAAHPLLSERRNIVVIADEAHRSQYDFIDGFARRMREALPTASFIGFTGTPIELTDKNTRAVFGDYIDTYDIQRAVEDGATVPIYYEGRLAKIELPERERPRVDEEFEEVTEGEEAAGKEKLKSKWARLEAMVGTEKRLRLIAADLVKHVEARQAGDPATPQKAMVVCMSRRICVELYREIVRLRPEWHGESDDAGRVKVVMTGSASDPVEWQQHIRSKPRREALARRFKDPDDPFRLVIVRDMWLTGFDAPSLATMYVDKPMRGHGLMQAIARVNRVFRDKQGGVVVDYLGIADQLKHALRDYTESGGEGDVAIDQAEAVAIMKAKYEVVCDMLHGFEWQEQLASCPESERLDLVSATADFVLGLEDGRRRFVEAVTALGKAFSLAVPHPDALQIRDHVGFFQGVRAALVKMDVGTRTGTSPEDLDLAVRQIVSRAVSTDEVIDIFAVAGVPHPDISVLDDHFLAEVRDLPRKNLAVELLRKLLNDEIKARFRRNVVEQRSFSEMLEQAIRQYNLRALTTVEVIDELIKLARELREAHNRGEQLGLGDDELAFYDALGTNDSAVAVLGDETLKTIAQELVATVKRNATIDWSLRESARAKMRVMVKRLLRTYGYPPDKQEQATVLVLQQAEARSEEWAA